MNGKGMVIRGLIAAGAGLVAAGLASGVALADPDDPVPPPAPAPAPLSLTAATLPAPAPAPAAAVPVQVTSPVMPDVPAVATDFSAAYVEDLATNDFGGFEGYSGSNALAMGYAACGAGPEWDDQVAAVQNAAGGAMSERDAKFVVQSAHIYMC